MKKALLLAIVFPLFLSSQIQAAGITIQAEAGLNGAIKNPYETSFRVNGGVAPYHFSVSSGSLPDGVQLTPAACTTGKFCLHQLDQSRIWARGIPKAIGRFNFTVLVKDAQGAIAVKQFSAEIGQAAYFEFRDSRSEYTFKVTDPAVARRAREILRDRLNFHVGGFVVKKRERYNPKWNTHLDPSRIYFFQFAVEVCDSSIQGIEDLYASGGYLPGHRWCHWSSQLVREIAEEDIK